MHQRVLVVGAGGIGGVVACCLQEAGVDVVVLLRPGRTADAVLAHGLQITDGSGTRAVDVRATCSLDDDQRFDWVLLTTQPNDLQDALDQVVPHLASDGRLVTLQNGLCEARAAEVVGLDRVVGGVVAWGASVDAPGKVRRTSGGSMTLGTMMGGDDAALSRLGDLLSSVSEVAFTDNLEGTRWTKLAFNCAISTLGTLGGDRVGPLLRRHPVRTLALEVLAECVEVARAEGVTLAPLAGWIDLEALAAPEVVRRGGAHPSLWWRHLLLLVVGLRIRDLRSSMLRAIEAGREPAVDFLNGEVVRAAARHGLAVPINTAATAWVHEAAQGTRALGVETLKALHAETRRGPTR